MWIKRTPDEVAKWHETSAQEARAHGRLIGGMIWVLGSFFAAGGWYVGFQSGVFIQFNRGGTYWGRLVILIGYVADCVLDVSSREQARVGENRCSNDLPQMRFRWRG
jgi:hypothetical protein